MAWSLAACSVSADIERRPHLKLLRLGHLGERPRRRSRPACKAIGRLASG